MINNTKTIQDQLIHYFMALAGLIGMDPNDAKQLAPRFSTAVIDTVAVKQTLRESTGNHPTPDDISWMFAQSVIEVENALWQGLEIPTPQREAMIHAIRKAIIETAQEYRVKKNHA